MHIYLRWSWAFWGGHPAYWSAARSLESGFSWAPRGLGKGDIHSFLILSLQKISNTAGFKTNRSKPTEWNRRVESQCLQTESLMKTCVGKTTQSSRIQHFLLEIDKTLNLGYKDGFCQTNLTQFSYFFRFELDSAMDEDSKKLVRTTLQKLHEVLDKCIRFSHFQGKRGKNLFSIN